MKRKVGDKVKIREDLVTGKLYDNTTLYPEMGAHLGHEDEVVFIENNHCRLKNIGFWWSDEMLEDINETFTKEEVKDIALHVLNMGMELRQAQMNGYHVEKSGKELLEEYLKTKGV